MDADSDYKAIGESLEANAWVRTGPKAKATFEFPDGTELRVNENTEIQVGSSRRIELKMGEIFLIAVNGSETFALKTPFSDMTLAQGTFDINFFNRDPNSPEAKRVSKTVTEVTVIAGQITIPSKRYTQQVDTGYWCTLVDGTLNTPNQMGDPVVSSRWTHELLLKRGKMTPEIEQRLRILMQMLGRYGKHEDLSDQAIRALGDLATPFLAEYLKFPSSPQETSRRLASAKILQEHATKAQIPDLVPTLQDPDADTRVAIAKTLERLAGTNLKYDEAYWRGGKCEAGQKAWEEWARKNAPPKK
jgi:hypothetical protein